MFGLKTALVLALQGLSAATYEVKPSTTTVAPTTTTSTYPTVSGTACPTLNYTRVNITSPATIKTGQNFTIKWESPKPDASKNHTEARVELWALNGGPVNSPLIDFKSARLFDTFNYTVNFNTTKYVNATTKGGAIVWQLFVAVHSTYYDRNITDLESWNLPYYGVQKVKFE